MFAGECPVPRKIMITIKRLRFNYLARDLRYKKGNDILHKTERYMDLLVELRAGYSDVKYGSLLLKLYGSESRTLRKVVL